MGRLPPRWGGDARSGFGSEWRTTATGIDFSSDSEAIIRTTWMIVNAPLEFAPNQPPGWVGSLEAESRGEFRRITVRKIESEEDPSPSIAVFTEPVAQVMRVQALALS